MSWALYHLIFIVDQPLRNKDTASEVFLNNPIKIYEQQLMFYQEAIELNVDGSVNCEKKIII